MTRGFVIQVVWCFLVWNRAYLWESSHACNVGTRDVVFHRHSTPLISSMMVQRARISESLRAGRSGDRTRPHRPWCPSSLLHIAYQVFPRGKAAGAWRWPPVPPSSAEVKERVELYLYSPSAPSWPVLGWTSRMIVQRQSVSSDDDVNSGLSLEPLFRSQLCCSFSTWPVGQM